MNEAALCAGTYDPITLGHLDVMERAARIFPRVVIAVAPSVGKNPLFEIEERVELVKACTAHLSGVEVEVFDGLLVDFARKKSVHVMVRGLRAFSDFEYEFQMALMNRRLNREVQTVFLMTGLRWIYTSSSIIKQAAQFGGSIKGMVPPLVEKKIREKYRKISE